VSNVLGVLRGADPALASEVLIVGAHYDALGIRTAVNGDSIVNGADDDGSGVVAVLEAARIVAAGPRPSAPSCSRRSPARNRAFSARAGIRSTRSYRWRSMPRTSRSK
jgi:Zn-dependent M28 family amino/carboxypeptidase